MAAHLPKYIAIMGATATGKSALAISLAQHFAGEVVSMDSRQVYRGMDIGTGKVSPGEQALVPHHLIDIVGPLTSWNTGRHVEALKRVMFDIGAAGNVPLLVGGTGLYFRTLFDGLLDVQIAEESLAGIRRGFKKRSTTDLYAELEATDPDRAVQMSPNDRVRITRALELMIHTGKTATALYAAQRSSGATDDGLRIVLTMPRHLLRARIAQRTRDLFAAGWPAEVRRLINDGVGHEAPGMKSLGYGEIAAALRDHVDPDACLETVIVKTQQYAKRQETFFRSVSGAHWIDVSTPEFAEKASDLVSRFLSGDTVPDIE